MQKYILMAEAVLAANLTVNADVNMPSSAFKRSSGGYFVGAGIAGAKWIHKFDNGKEITVKDCPKVITAEEVATFSGPTGTYEIKPGLLAKNNFPGSAKWWIKINGKKVAGGTCLVSKSCYVNGKVKPLCASKTLCNNSIQEISAAKGIAIKTGDKISFGGVTSWPCGCGGARGGYYPGYQYIKFIGGKRALPKSSAEIENNTVRNEIPLPEKIDAKKYDVQGKIIHQPMP